MVFIRRATPNVVLRSKLVVKHSYALVFCTSDSIRGNFKLVFQQ